MAEYIEREKLMTFPIRIDNYDKENGDLNVVLCIECVLEYAQNLPTVDAVEVVRCKDCNYYTHGVCWNENITGNCDCDLEKEPNGYCDWGERRGD